MLDFAFETGEEFVLRGIDPINRGCHRHQYKCHARNSPVAFHEIQVGQLQSRIPAQVVENQVARLAGIVAYAKENQLDGIFAGVGELVAGDDLTAAPRMSNSSSNSRASACFGTLAGLYFAARKFPLQRMRLAGRALPHQNRFAVLENRRHYLNHVNTGA